MSGVQKVIKYIAMGFAGLLAMVIICAVIGGIAAAANGISGGKAFGGETASFSETYQNVKSLDIDSGFNTVNIRTDKTLDSTGAIRVDFNDVSTRYKCKMSGSELKIYGEASGFWNLFGLFDNEGEGGAVDVWLPEGFRADKVKLDGGMGDLYAEDIKTEHMTVDGGMGNITIDSANAERTDIDSGMGNITLTDASVGECDIDGGMGNIGIDGRMDGDAKIDGGMGDIELRLEGSVRSYNIKTSGSMGDIRVNGKSYGDGTQYSENAPYKMDIDGGMGNVTIRFSEDPAA